MKPVWFSKFLQVSCLWVLVQAGTANAQPRGTQLSFAISDSAYSAPALIAADQGFFADEGLNVRVMKCQIGRICLKHLLDGEAQLATVADTPIAFASFMARNFGIVATMTRSGGDTRLLVRTDSHVRAAADLRGKKIGVLKGTSAHYFVDSILLFHGIRQSEVQLVWLDPSDPLGPFVRGQIDAAAYFAPHVHMAVQRLGNRVGSLEVPHFVETTFNLVSSPSPVVQDEDLVKVLKSLRRAIRLIHDSPDTARAIVARSVGTPQHELELGWKNFSYQLELSQSLITTLEAQARWAVREKFVPAGSPMPDYLGLLRSRPLKQVDPALLRIAH